MKGRILIIDDDRSMGDMLISDLGRRGFEPLFVDSTELAGEKLKKEDLDVILTDINMPGRGGIEFCRHVSINRPDLPVIVITGFGSMETAIAAIRAGAYDFISKPVDLDILALSLERAVKQKRLQEEVRVLTETVKEFAPYEELIGESRAIRELTGQLGRIAKTEASVMITGESGTGKEVIARILHKESLRAKKPFVAINCAALPEPLLESELFGHKKGAFTDAREDRKGLFLKAHGGTLFLDEVGEMPPSLQAKLLRVLEERRLRPVGGNEEVSFDVRLLSATNRDLEGDAFSGHFREDLFYRLNVIHLTVPPLREREKDILLLARHFVGRFASQSGKKVKGIAEKAAQLLLDYSWPGNVRELSNALERAVALTLFDRITVDDLPEKIRCHHRPHLPSGLDFPDNLISLEELEKRYIAHVLDAVDGNRTVAARILGLDRKTLYRKLLNN